MLVSKKPYVVEARQKLSPKKPHFALKTGEKFTQTYRLNSLIFIIEKIWKEVIIWLSKSKHKQNTSKPLLLLLCIRKNKIITADDLLYRS